MDLLGFSGSEIQETSQVVGIMPTPKQVYSAQFKQEAVQLVRTSGKSCAEIARNLGVPAHYLVRWKKQQEQHEQAGRPVFTGRGKAALSAPTQNWTNPRSFKMRRRKLFP